MSWIQTYTGKKVYPLAMKPSDVDILDIAHSLSMQCRFNGHTKRFYSVAEHSAHIALHSSKQNRLWGLLHDASEAYLCDLPRPLKHHPDFAQYKEAESNCMKVICEAFGLPQTEPIEIKHLDRRILVTEALQLMQPFHPDWENAEEPLEINLPCLNPEHAKEFFLVTYHRITGIMLY